MTDPIPDDPESSFDTTTLFDFVPGLPVEKLHKELAIANAITALGKRKLARCLSDMQERGVFALTGHSSAVHYAIAKLKMDRRRALESVQIGRQLEGLPEIDAALVAGELSWSKLRIILRVVVQNTQVAWLDRADESSCKHLSTEVSRCSPGDPPRKENGGGLSDIRMTVRGSLLLINHQMWEQAKQKLSEEACMAMTNEDMMIYAARLILSTDAEGKAEGRSKVKHSPFQLIVHQDTVQQDTVQQDTVQQDTVQQDTVQQDTVQQDTVQQDTVQQDTVQQDTVQQDTVQQDTVQQDTVQQDTVQQDTVQQDTVQQDTVQQDTVQQDTVQRNTVQQGSTHQHPGAIRLVRTRVHTDHGDVELPPDQADRVAEQAEIVPASAPAADPDAKTATRMVRRVLARDNQRCQNCSASLHLHVHHVVFRALGGKTEEDLLVTVCTKCHSMIHSGLLSLHGDASGGFVFLDRSGTRVDAPLAPLPIESLRHAAHVKPSKSFVEGLLSITQRCGMRRELAPALRPPLLRGSRAE